MTNTVLSSATKEVIIGFDHPFVIIGERINPTGRKILAAEMVAGDLSRVEADALAQVVAGAHMNAYAHEHRLQRARDDDDQEDQRRDPVGCQHRQACHRHCRCRNCAWYVGCVFFSLSRPQTCTHALQNTHVVCTVFAL